MTGFAASLDLRGRRVLVCGAGADALPAVHALLAAAATVTAIATDVGATVADLEARGLLTLERRRPVRADLEQASLVVPASGDPERDAEVIRLAAEVGVPAAEVGAPALEPRTADPDGSGTGSVTLVGGGPGDPGLLTVAGLAAIRSADVIVCDRLAPLATLQHARPDARIVDVAKIPRGAFTSQERINQLLVEHASSGRRVVRLKGGDSFVFGRGGEEWQACAAAGVPVTVIPGVSSAVAVPALAGIPVTHRDLTQGFTVISGHLPPGDPGSTLDWAALARTNTTLVIMMGVATLPAITASLLGDGMAPDTPALTVADGGLPSQRDVRGTVADIAARTASAGITPPAITVIGAVAGFNPNG